MSATINAAFISQFSDNIHTLVRERGSKLRGIFPTVDAPGEKHFFERIDKLTVSEVTSRKDNTSLQDPAHTRRMATLKRYSSHTYLDDLDKIKLLIDPTNEYARALADAHGDNFDVTLYDQLLGTASTGADGTGTQAFDTSNNQIAHGSAGLTVAKIHQALRILENSEIDIDSEELFMCVGALGVEDLLTDTTNGVQLSSFDYQDSKTMATGRLPNFRGINIVRTQRVPDETADTTYRALLFARDAMKVAVKGMLEVKTAERADLNYLTQVSAYMNFGGVRMEEKKVVDILYQ
jgi:hypothetical protein